MPKTDLSLIAHLLRRAGFSARRDELEQYASRSYEEIVDDLVHPERFPDVEQDLLDRYLTSKGYFTVHWAYRMANSPRRLQEKMVLFWHQLFPTSPQKSIHSDSSKTQIEMFRRLALSDVRTLLIELSRDPAMIFWLDNNENDKDEPNENYGRELLELFSMGVGNYTEDDVKAATMAFTGWSLETALPGLGPTDVYPTRFIYMDTEHDDTVKSFLGETGRFNGEDIVDIIVKQPATARFIARQFYNFFVADEPAVAAWNEIPPQAPDAVDDLASVFMQSDGDSRVILRHLFNADYFKRAAFKKVKSPVEMTMGVLKLIGTHRDVDPGIGPYLSSAGSMGQSVMNPPTVEGWHTGEEWIDGGTLNSRVNFAVDELADDTTPAVQTIAERLSAFKRPLAPDEFVDGCLDFAGPLPVGAETRSTLLELARSGGELRFESEDDREDSKSRVVQMLQLIVSTREYQFG